MKAIISESMVSLNELWVFFGWVELEISGILPYIFYIRKFCDCHPGNIAEVAVKR
jgi:hypothetical protein